MAGETDSGALSHFALAGRFPDDYLLPVVVVAIVAVLVAWEVLDHSLRQGTKKALLASIFAALIAWIDFGSFVTLLILSFATYGVTRGKLDLARIRVAIVPGMITLLIILKNNNLVLATANPIALIGLSFYFFRLTSFLLDASHEPEEHAAIPLLDFLLWAFWLPIFFAGPIQRYRDFEPLSDEANRQNKHWFYLALALALLGKVAVVDLILNDHVLTPLRDGPAGHLETYVWSSRLAVYSLHGGLSFLHGYLDLMLYTEIAKAAARILGYRCVDNFNRPLLATNIAQFWQRWHMSLSQWSRDYVYFPVIVATRKRWAANYLTMAVIAIWHSINLNWLLWAVAHGTALNIHAAIRGTESHRRTKKTRRGAFLLMVSGWATTLMFVSVVYNFVAFGNDYQRAFDMFWKTVGLY